MLPNILRGSRPGEGTTGGFRRGWRSAFLRARRSTSSSALGLLFRTAILFATRARTLREALGLGLGSSVRVQAKIFFFGTALLDNA
jgi:hypothetical protein